MRNRYAIAIATLACTLGLAAAAPSAFGALFYGYESGGAGRIDVDATDQIDGLISSAPFTLDVATTSTPFGIAAD